MTRSPRPVRLRRGHPADDAACAAVMRAAIRAIPPGEHGAAELAAWASLPALYHRWAMGPGGESFLVAEAGRRVVGYAALRGPELTALFVLPRSQRQGVARALVERAAQAARRAGAVELRVDAARSAVGAYRALGFVPVRRTRVPLPGGASLAATRMRLRLTPDARRAGHGQTGEGWARLSAGGRRPRVPAARPSRRTGRRRGAR